MADIFHRLGSLHFGAGRTRIENESDQNQAANQDVVQHHLLIESEDEEPDTFVFSFRRLLQHTGPAFLMCIAFVDPGNLEADLQTGARTGYDLLWVLLWSTAMGGLLQALAARLGVATRCHLAQHCRNHYPPPARIALWLMAELAIIGSDIQEVIGTAIALLLLSGGRIPLWAGTVIAAISAYFLLLLEKFGQHWLERSFQLAVAVMSLSFASMFLGVGVPYGQLVKGLIIPRLSRPAFPVACGLLGSIIMPHNLYLHSALVHSRVIPGERPASKKESIKYYTIESVVALCVTLVINICVISVFSKGFFGKESASGIGLENAGAYLGERFGGHMAFIWAVGLLAAGQSSTMTGTYAGQFVMSGFLKLKIKPTMRALLTRAVAIVPALTVALKARSSDDSTQLDLLNQALNILQSIQLPFAVVPLLIFTSRKDIMGEAYTTPKSVSITAWIIATLIMGINAGTVYETAIEHLPSTFLAHSLFWSSIVLYIGFVVYLVIGVSSEVIQGGDVDGVGELLLGDDGDGGSRRDEAAAPVLP